MPPMASPAFNATALVSMGSSLRPSMAVHSDEMEKSAPNAIPDFGRPTKSGIEPPNQVSPRRLGIVARVAFWRLRGGGHGIDEADMTPVEPQLRGAQGSF